MYAADRDPMAALVIGTIDQETAHFGEGDLLRAFHSNRRRSLQLRDKLNYLIHAFTRVRKDLRAGKAHDCVAFPDN